MRQTKTPSSPHFQRIGGPQHSRGLLETGSLLVWDSEAEERTRLRTEEKMINWDRESLMIAVRNKYRLCHDYDKVVGFFDTLYASGRLGLPFSTLTVVG